MIPTMPDLNAVGALVRLRTAHTQYTGRIFAYDQQTGTVVLQDEGEEGTEGAKSAEHPLNAGAAPVNGSSKRHTFHILAIPSILAVERCEGEDTKAPPGLDAAGLLVPIRPIDMARVAAREEAALGLEQERMARLGVDVSPEGQVCCCFAPCAFVFIFLVHSPNLDSYLIQLVLLCRAYDII
jgi:hypothetical protein